MRALGAHPRLRRLPDSMLLLQNPQSGMRGWTGIARLIDPSDVAPIGTAVVPDTYLRNRAWRCAALEYPSNAAQLGFSGT
jgi:hypothetical protein